MTPYYSHDLATIYQGHGIEVLATMPAESVQCAVTSPPYWGLRDYGTEPQEWPEVSFAPMPGLEHVVIPAGRASLGQEPEPMAFVGHLVEVFRRVRRVLKPDGVAWLNLGDTYCTVPHGPKGANSADPKDQKGGRERHGDQVNRRHIPGIKHKDLLGIPWRVAFALQADGWYLRSEIITDPMYGDIALGPDYVWSKPNPMPESVKDRCTRAHEQVFMLAKSDRYYYDGESIADACVRGHAGSKFTTGKTAEHQLNRAGQGERIERATRNKRDVWTIASQPFAEAHFATMPPDLARPPIRATSRPGDLVLDPFTGAATTGLVAVQEGRRFVGCELSADYCAIAKRRLVRVLAGEVEALSGTEPEDLGPLFAEGA